MKKRVFIMGDSYSTYKGYIPEGYLFYYSDERKDAPVVRGVERTWWHRLAAENDLTIVKNDSFSGSTVCNTVRPTLGVESSFVSRMDRYLAEGFFAENGIDTMLILGGTNDSWIDSPIGALQYADFAAEDLKHVLPAFCYLIDKARAAVAELLVILNTDLKEEIANGVTEACEHLGVHCLRLAGIDKENGHPTELGMRQISEQVAAYLQKSSTT